MFEISQPSPFLESHRVPHARAGARDGPGGPGRCAWWRADGGRYVAWPAGASTAPLVAAEVGGIPVYCRLEPDGDVARRLAASGTAWRRVEPIVAAGDGDTLGAIWRDDAGNCFLPFDPDAARAAYLREEYLHATRSAASLRASATARRLYYRARPLLPRRAQLALRRVHSRARGRTSFPRWPVECALHDLDRLLLRLLADLAGRPVPTIAPWPAGYTSAVVLTHDVETATGYANIDLLRTIERERGFRSSWNLVPERYPVEDDLVRRLLADGFEVGVHGLRHDGRDLESRATLDARLPAMRRWAERWQAVGFRSPATQRAWELIERLPFDYDSSFPDSDPYEPQAGGCCSWLPFFVGDVVELPVTLVQDHTLFVILGAQDGMAWHEKAAHLRAAGGMALLITHPDYMLDESRLDAYRRFLDTVAGDPTVWQALPREVSAWWRRRAASTLRADGDRWRIAGPAADEGAVALVGLDAGLAPYASA